MRSFTRKTQPAWANTGGNIGLPMLVFLAPLEVIQFQARLLTLGVQVSLLPVPLPLTWVAEEKQWVWQMQSKRKRVLVRVWDA